jgi:hypothetical protein
MWSNLADACLELSPLSIARVYNLIADADTLS